jgi:hypothetical protein
MIDYTILYIFIFLIISVTLIKASISDIQSRKIPIKSWNCAVYIALPLSFIPLSNKIWDGAINITNPIQSIWIVYPLFIIGFLFIISSYTKSVHIGGADFIAITIILLTFISMHLSLPILFMAAFIICSVISAIITYLIKNRGFKIPLIVTISFAYFITILYFIFGSSTLPLS